MDKKLGFFILFSVLSSHFLCNKLHAQLSNSYNLPLVVINTNGKNIPDEPKIKVQIGIIDNGPGQLNLPSDSSNIYNGWALIEKRGNSSQQFPKKSYGFETIDQSGAKLNVKLLGLPEENDWVLYAPYSDKSMMRNALMYQLSREMGFYAPRTKFCELFLNGVYQGVFLLTEKIKQDKNRVDISKLNPDDISGDELTGGYILKVDWAEAGNGWYTTYSHKGEDPNANAMILYVDPNVDNLKTEQKNYIRNYVTQFENSLKSTDFNNTQTGYPNYIDVPSFLDFIICNELSNNVDAYSLSTFFYKDKDSKGGKLTMGPLWDFDLAFGNSDYGGYQGTFSYDTYLDPAPKWFTRLLEDASFSNSLNCRWKELRGKVLKMENVISLIDSMSFTLAEAQGRNNSKWNLYGRYVWPNDFVGKTYKEEIDYMKGWINERFNWLDINLPGKCSLVSDDPALKNPIGFSLYPNPNNGKFRISIDESNNTELNYKIFNFQGQLIKSGQLNSAVTEFNIEGLSKGIYIFKHEELGHQWINKFLVQ